MVPFCISQSKTKYNINRPHNMGNPLLIKQPTTTHSLLHRSIDQHTIRSLPKESLQPLLPPAVERPQQLEPGSLGADGVVDRMDRHQFQMLQRPVERDRRCEEIHRAILVPEFSRIVRGNRDWIAQAQQNGSRG